MCLISIQKQQSTFETASIHLCFNAQIFINIVGLNYIIMVIIAVILDTGGSDHWLFSYTADWSISACISAQNWSMNKVLLLNTYIMLGVKIHEYYITYNIQFFKNNFWKFVFVYWSTIMMLVVSSELFHLSSN